MHGSSLVTSLQIGTLAVGRGLYRHWLARLEQDVRIDPACDNRPRTLQQTGLAPNAGNIPGETKYHTKGSLTWYRPGLFLGNHEFKSGFDYTDHDLSRGWINRPDSAGNYQLVFRNDVPFASEHVELSAQAAQRHALSRDLRHGFVVGDAPADARSRRAIRARQRLHSRAGCSENGQFSVGAVLSRGAVQHLEHRLRRACISRSTSRATARR